MSDTKISVDTLESKEARRKKRKAENSKRWKERSAYNEKRRCEYQAELQKVPDKNRAKVVQMAVDSSKNVYIKAAAASKCSGGDGVAKNNPIDNVDTNIDVDEDVG